MNQPLVSVVMPVRSMERFLPEAIDSILGQTFKDFELIIVDFGSTDSSQSILSGYAAADKRIRFTQIPACALPVARNAGCALARGKYIAVMDADDISMPDRLEREVNFMEAHPQIALLGSATEWIDLSGRSLGTHLVPGEYRQIKLALPTRCPFWHPTLLMRRDAFLAVGGYRPAFVCSHDYDLELRIAERFECANLQQSVLKYRIHPSQLTFHKQRQQTLCKLAARASANLRGSGNHDPLDDVGEITPELLTTMGVSDAAQQSALACDCRNWIRSMTAAGEYKPALEAAWQMLASHRDGVERWQIADLYLAIARLYWKQRNLALSFLALVRAILVRPTVVARPVRPILSRLRLVSEREAELAGF